MELSQSQLYTVFQYLPKNMIGKGVYLTADMLLTHDVWSH